MKLALWYPFPTSTIAQGFGANDNGSYAAEGLKGHTGIDFAAPWGTPIPNCLEGAYVYALLNRGNPDLMKYRAVCTIWDDPQSDMSYEVTYGHVSSISAVVGNTLKPGDVIANVGNTGDVFTDGVEVTAADKAAGSHAGAHLHFQLRVCKRVPTYQSPPNQYLFDGNGILYRNGSYYEVVDYGNGYNGCVSPVPFFNGYQASKFTTVVGILIKLVSLLTQEKAMLQTNT